MCLYMVIEAVGPDTLREEVEANMKIGWAPQGGVSIVNLRDGDFLYAQAMIKWREQ